MRLSPILKNRYFLLSLGFVIIMLFFDNNSLLRQVKLSRNLREAKDMKRFYQEEIKRNEAFILKLNSDMDFAEKVAREKYYMKRDNEDVFVIVTEEED